jgi:hypothetical protein
LIRALAGLALLGHGLAALATADDKTLQWVEEVVLRPALGGERTATRRWIRSPRLSIIGGSAKQRKAVNDAVKHLNETLKKTPIKKIAMGPTNDTTADIQVYFQIHSRLPELARTLRIAGYKKKFLSLHWAFIDTEQFFILRSHVLLASDKLKKDPELRHNILWALAGALGLQNNSSIYKDSLFRGSAGNAQQLSDLDRKLIVFFYNHVPPGSANGEVAEAFKKNWPKGE